MSDRFTYHRDYLSAPLSATPPTAILPPARRYPPTASQVPATLRAIPEPELQTIDAALASLETAVQRLVDRREGCPTVELRRLVRAARHHYAIRRRRDAALGGLFGEPAWDMLLDLFIRTAEGSKTPIKNLCLASCTPTSTAMRWIDRLLELGLIEKSTDDEDARRSLARLTDRGWQAIVTVLQAS